MSETVLSAEQHADNPNRLMLENVIYNTDHSVKQISILTLTIHHKTQSNTDDDDNYSC